MSEIGLILRQLDAQRGRLLARRVLKLIRAPKAMRWLWRNFR